MTRTWIPLTVEEVTARRGAACDALCRVAGAERDHVAGQVRDMLGPALGSSA